MSVALPLQKSGVYLLTAKLADSSTSRIIIWLEDTAIVRKPLAEGMFFYYPGRRRERPADRPRSISNSSAFRQKPIGGGTQVTIDTLNFAEQTDADGQLVHRASRKRPSIRG